MTLARKVETHAPATRLYVYMQGVTTYQADKELLTREAVSALNHRSGEECIAAGAHQAKHRHVCTDEGMTG